MSESTCTWLYQRESIWKSYCIILLCMTEAVRGVQCVRTARRTSKGQHSFQPPQAALFNLPGGSAAKITESSFHPGKSKCRLGVKGHRERTRSSSSKEFFKTFTATEICITAAYRHPHCLEASPAARCQTSSAKPGE